MNEAVGMMGGGNTIGASGAYVFTRTRIPCRREGLTPEAEGGSVRGSFSSGDDRKEDVGMGDYFAVG